MTVKFGDTAQQEVWQTLRSLNDAWTRGNPADLDKFFHPRMVAITATDRLRLEGRDACRDAWINFTKVADIHHWQETDPRIQIYGNTAVVTYYYNLSFTQGGKKMQFDGRDMFVFVKEGGKWWSVANHFSPYPAA